MSTTQRGGAPDAALHQAESAPSTDVPAGVLRRLLALIFDVVAVTLLIFVGAGIVSALVGPTVAFDPGSAAGPSPLVTVRMGMVVLNAVVGTSISGAYFVLPWLVRNASPGQLLLGIRVRRDDRRASLSPPLSAGRAILRWILLFPPFGVVAALTADVPGLGALVWGSAPVWYLILGVTTIRSPTGQGLHDRMTGTAVCRARTGGVPGVR